MNERNEIQDAETVSTGNRERRTRHLRYVRPAVDIHSTDSEVVLLADVPGVRKSELVVEVEGDYLAIEGRVAGRRERESALPWGYHRRFRLSPGIDRDRIKARLEDGVLRVRLSKVGRADSKRVEIE